MRKMMSSFKSSAKRFYAPLTPLFVVSALVLCAIAVPFLEGASKNKTTVISGAIVLLLLTVAFFEEKRKRKKQ